MTRYSSPGFEALLEKIAARDKCMLVVRCDQDLAGGRAAYKLYVDGYIFPSLSKDVAPETWVIPMTEGPHRVVLREFDAQKSARAESNTLQIELGPKQQMHLFAQSSNGALSLSQDPAPHASGDGEPRQYAIAMPALDLNAVEDALVTLSIKAITGFAAEHTQETFYAFGFDCNGDDGNVLLCLNTEEAFEKTAAEYVAEWNYTPEDLAELKMNSGDWEYQGFNQKQSNWKADWAPHERAVMDYLEFNEISDQERDQIIEEIMCCCCRALVRVEQSGILDLLQKTPGFYTQVTDHDESGDKAASRLQRVRRALG